MNETLCVLSNNFGSTPRDSLTAIFSQFYTDAEIAEAKKILVDLAEQLSPKPDELKKVHKRVGGGKRTRETEDVLLLYTLLDSKKFAFPRFLAANSHRVPSIKEMELCKVTASVAELTLQVADINSALVKVTDACATITSQVSVIPMLGSNTLSAGLMGASSSSAATTHMTSLAVPEVPVSKDDEDDSAGGSWCYVDARGRTVKSTFASMVSSPPSRPKPQPPRRKIVGAKSGSTKLISSSESKTGLWHLFVGKMKKDTTEAALQEYLEENGITVSQIVKLKATQEWQQKSAAFHISVAQDCKDQVMVADFWPHNVEVRDWFFKPK